MLDFSFSALSSENWPFSLEWLPEQVYLVGGAVRDALLSRTREYLDLDFVMPGEAVQTAERIARYYNAGFVLLDAKRQIARVVFEGITVDFARQEGETLEKDLWRRDLTMNAIAYNPRTRELIDPLAGCADLEAGIIRMVSPQNLQDDPLRLLRAYRQAAQLDFAIEAETVSTIGELAPFLSRVAAERVRTELNYLLANARGTRQLQAAWENGLLEFWFPHATREGLGRVAAVDRTLVTLAEHFAARPERPGLGELLQTSVLETQKTSRTSIAKLALLLNADPQIAEAQLLRLKYSRAEVRTAIASLRVLPQLQAGEMSLPEQYFFFRDVGEAFPTAIALAVATGVEVETIAPLIHRYLDPDDPAAHPTPLVTGKDLMKALELPSGRRIGKLLTEIQIARVEGKVSTRSGALELAKHLVRK